MKVFTKPEDSYTAYNGVEIPCIALGTWQTPCDITAQAVRAAVECGYRHIDGAAGYNNEEGVGEGIATCGIPRDQLFVTSKLWNTERGYDKALQAFQKTCRDLRTSYLDLFMLHWPANPIQFPQTWQAINSDTWRALEHLYNEGYVKAIGFSNFMPHHLISLIKNAQVLPHVCQQELHVGLNQKETVRFCREYGMLIEAYSPMGSGSLARNGIILAISDKYHVSPQQLCIRWCLQNDMIPLPKSTHPQRIKENADIFGFEIDATDMRVLDNVPFSGGLNLDPDYVRI
ncbi:MAG: aldo/keto reductase [Oscillospiraceae bacterium]|nr:aldo/keto reductase [Oscillospiraceae bacterium]